MSRNSCDHCGGIQGAHTADCPNQGGLMTQPTDEQMRAYLDGEHGPPSAEAVQIVQDELERDIRSRPTTPGAPA